MKVLMWAAGVWVVRTPQIDVWHLQQHAIDYLLSGRNPYTEAVPDVYQGGASFGYQPFYAYAPLNLLLSTPAKVLFGDYRAGMVLALRVLTESQGPPAGAEHGSANDFVNVRGRARVAEQFVSATEAVLLQFLCSAQHQHGGMA